MILECQRLPYDGPFFTMRMATLLLASRVNDVVDQRSKCCCECGDARSVDLEKLFGSVASAPDGW